MIALLKQMGDSKLVAGILRALMLLAVAVLTIMAVGVRKQHQIRDVFIDLHGGDKEQLINESYLDELLKEEYGGDLAGVPSSFIDMNELEELVRQDAFIKHAEAYLDADMNLHLEVESRQPLARLDDGQVRFYIDEEGVSMPMSSRYSARVPVVLLPPNGQEFLTEDRRVSLVKLLTSFQSDHFMNNLVDQIVVDGLNQYFIIPHIGDERIKFGSIDRLEDKIENIKVFYKKKMSQGHFGQCKWIDARYAGQIICDLNKLENS